MRRRPASCRIGSYSRGDYMSCTIGSQYCCEYSICVQIDKVSQPAPQDRRSVPIAACAIDPCNLDVRSVGRLQATAARHSIGRIWRGSNYYYLDLWVIIKLASARSIAECIYCICKFYLGSKVSINQAELGVGPGRVEVLDS